MSDFDGMDTILADALAGMAGETGKVTISTSTPGAYDNATATVTLTTVTQVAYGVEAAYEAKDVDGTLIRTGDKQLLVPAYTSAGVALTTPVPDATKITFASGVVWTVKGVETVAPDQVAALYILQIRKGG